MSALLEPYWKYTAKRPQWCCACICSLMVHTGRLRGFSELQQIMRIDFAIADARFNFKVIAQFYFSLHNSSNCEVSQPTLEQMSNAVSPELSQTNCLVWALTCPSQVHQRTTNNTTIKQAWKAKRCLPKRIASILV